MGSSNPSIAQADPLGRVERWRECGQCGRQYEKSTPGSGHKYCSDRCRKDAKNSWHQRNRDARREYAITRRYGISPLAYRSMMKAQDGKCAICGNEITVGGGSRTSEAQLDGTVRGLLCRRCNSGLAYLNDSTELLRKAIKYLTE